ncbi:hypothetical protein BRCON_1151 [Candidatus Sumerlaea chitinivorans]|uniref:Uncharacterized protein n=1 Tax=Sumerlaea chitinivorans TaxID=2250252 RepID=A0A2Z4Y4W9_SUMC1|nr:hypothetical protein BRCON_1151 [Candidatus Sumerlaea chitinivorans]
MFCCQGWESKAVRLQNKMAPNEFGLCRVTNAMKLVGAHFALKIG